MKRPALCSTLFAASTLFLVGCSRISQPQTPQVGMQRVQTDGGNARWAAPIQEGGQSRISTYEAYRQISEVARVELPKLAAGQVTNQLGSDGDGVTLKPDDIQTSKVDHQDDGSWKLLGTVTARVTPSDKRSFSWTARALGKGSGEWSISDVKVEPAS